MLSWELSPVEWISQSGLLEPPSPLNIFILILTFPHHVAACHPLLATCLNLALPNSCHLLFSAVWCYRGSFSPTAYKVFSSLQSPSNAIVKLHCAQLQTFFIRWHLCSAVFFPGDQRLFRNGPTLSLVWACVFSLLVEQLNSSVLALILAKVHFKCKFIISISFLSIFLWVPIYYKEQRKHCIGLVVQFSTQQLGYRPGRRNIAVGSILQQNH